MCGRGRINGRSRLQTLAPAILFPILYAGVGGLLWLLAVSRFEKEGRS